VSRVRFFFVWCFEGLASDLKTVPSEMVRKRVLRTGDGNHRFAKENALEPASVDNNNSGEEIRDTEHFWGWGDKEMNDDDMKNVEILHKTFD